MEESSYYGYIARANFRQVQDCSIFIVSDSCDHGGIDNLIKIESKLMSFITFPKDVMYKSILAYKFTYINNILWIYFKYYRYLRNRWKEINIYKIIIYNRREMSNREIPSQNPPLTSSKKGVSKDKMRIVMNLYESGIAEEFIAMQLDLEIPEVIRILKEENLYKD